MKQHTKNYIPDNLKNRVWYLMRPIKGMQNKIVRNKLLLIESLGSLFKEM